MRLHSFLLIAAALSSSILARADSFTFTGSGVDDSFTLPSSPAVSASGPYGFTLPPVLVDENGVSALDQIAFFSQGEGGGLLLKDPAGNIFNGFGMQLYKGASGNPTFQLGTYALGGFAHYTLTIRNEAAVPEPSTLAPIVIGLLCIVWLLRRRLA